MRAGPRGRPHPVTRVRLSTFSARAVRHGGIGEVASADLVVVEVEALGEGGDGGRLDEREPARDGSCRAGAGVGGGGCRPHPSSRLWEAMSGRLEGHSQTVGGSVGVVHAHNLSMTPARHHGTLVDNFGVEKVVGPNGANPFDVALSNSGCPEPAELLEDFSRFGQPTLLAGSWPRTGVGRARYREARVRRTPSTRIASGAWAR